MAIMGLPTVTLEVPLALVREACLYRPGASQQDAVLYVLGDYGRLVGELRQAHRRLADFDSETDAFDRRLAALQAACRALLDL